VLRNTLERRNQACDFLAAKAREMQKFRRFDLRKLAYRDTRDMFGLTAQVVVRCIAKVAYAYKPDRQSQRSFRFISENIVSIWTVAGRQNIVCMIGRHQRRLFASSKDKVNLMSMRGKCYIACVCDIDDPALIEKADVLAADFDVVNIATVIDGKFHTADAIEKVRAHHSHWPAGLKRRGTEAAKRRLRKLSGRQWRI
jgi:putative transposase